jgi:phage/plasmid-associated DNA primase
MRQFAGGDEIIQCAPALPEKDRDADLGERLKVERPGFWNWMIEGWLALNSFGLHVPHVIQRETEQFFCDRNDLDAFFQGALRECPATEFLSKSCIQPIASGAC